MSQITTQPRNKHHRAMIGLNRSNGITGDDMGLKQGVLWTGIK